MAGFAEAEVMAAKGYTQKDVLQTEVQKAYAEGLGNVTVNGGGGIVGDMMGLGVGMAAAGAVVPQGMEIPDYHLAVGVPAKIRGVMDEERVLRNITSFAEANLIEARNMLAEGLMEHPSEDLFRRIGAIR
jgi:hypothetical protein